jgi:hypothetical protein
MIQSFRGGLVRSDTCLLAFCWVLACTASSQMAAAAAPGKPQKFAITDSRQAGDDFHVQGEYAGTTAQGYLGLQVVARGDGEFVAALYSGGLPGSGWNRTDRQELSGKRQGSHVILVNDNFRIEMAPMLASIWNDHGQTVGNLPKVDRYSSTRGCRPPADAEVLFDSAGGDLQGFESAKLNDEGLLTVGALTKNSVRDFRLHLEFRTPYMPYAKGQSRGNSGVYIQRRYEVQVLDSFGLAGAPNECGGLYRQQSPDLNMALPPLTWQTYDIYFTAARFDASGKKYSDAVITVLHNGVTIHDQYHLKNKTGAGRPEGPEALPILLQDHGNPVAFRNVWLSHSDKNHGKVVARPASKTRRRLFRRRRRG